LLLYSYFRKCSDSTEEAKSLKKKLAEKCSDLTEEAESLKKNLVEFEEENAKLKDTMAWQDKELLLSSQLMSVVQCEAFEASMARARVESKLVKLIDELNNLKAEHA
jgi:predicted nucleotide-binding protein (sugar kinase/HSP70/actin superfamily)